MENAQQQDHRLAAIIALLAQHILLVHWIAKKKDSLTSVRDSSPLKSRKFLNQFSKPYGLLHFLLEEGA
jgi:hypothetical protein